MLKLGELDVSEPEQLKSFGEFPNIKRLMTHIQANWPMKFDKALEQEDRQFKSVH